MFLTKQDLHSMILEDELQEIIRNDDTFVLSAIMAAVAEMRTYLFDTFDVDVIFAATGTNRHQLLVNVGCDIAIYSIVARCQAGQVIDDRKARYDRAVKFLKEARDTVTYNDLPRRVTTAQKHIGYGSNPKRKNQY